MKKNYKCEYCGVGGCGPDKVCRKHVWRRLPQPRKQVESDES